MPRRAALAAIAGLAVAPAVNLAFDPFGIFGARWWRRQPATLNERVWKVQALIALATRPDSLLLGSSISDMLPVAAAQAAWPGARFFNGSVFSGTPAAALAMLRAWETMGYQPRHVVYGLEPLAFHDVDHDSLALRDHWAAHGQTEIGFKLPYLYSAAGAEAAGRLAGELVDQADVRWDPLTGQCLLDRYEAEISADPARFEQLHLAHTRLARGPVTWLQERFEDLAQLRRHLDERGASLTTFWSPLHPQVREIYGEAALRQVQARADGAAGLAGTPLCSLLDEAPHAWYDFRHFRPRYAALVMGHAAGVAGVAGAPRVATR